MYGSGHNEEPIGKAILWELAQRAEQPAEVARRMREDPALAGVVLVALTGYGRDSDRQRSRDAGFDHHLVKPADFTKLKEILSASAEAVREA